MSSLLPDGWAIYNIKDVALSDDRYSFTGGPFGSNLKSEDYTEHGVRIIQLQNIGDGKFKNKYKIYTSEEKANELHSCNIYPNDIILSKMGDPVARAVIMPNYAPRYLMASDGIRLAVDNSKFDTKFIHDTINAVPFRSQAETHSTGSTRKRIGLTELRQLKFIAPPLPEQQKIAAILTSVDEVIEKTQVQIDKLKDLKTGMMQELLTKGIGHTEFKDSPVGRIPVSWQVDTLDNIAKVIDCKHATPKYFSEGFAVVKPGNIKEGNLDINGCALTDKSGFDNLNENHLPVVGDTIYSRNQTYGIGAYVHKSMNFAIGQDVCVIHPKNCDSRFIYYVVNAPVVRVQVELLAAGSTFKRINLGAIRKLLIPVPSHDEQVQITKVLSSIDVKAGVIGIKLLSLQNTKKALMQDLLTGKVRVTVPTT